MKEFSDTIDGLRNVKIEENKLELIESRMRSIYKAAWFFEYLGGMIEENAGCMIITYQGMADKTGVAMPDCVILTRKLMDCKILLRTKAVDNGVNYHFSINENFEEWHPETIQKFLIEVY